MAAKTVKGCPSPHCEAGHPHKQRPPTDGELKRLSEATRKTIQTATTHPLICSYCQCVYLHGGRILEYLEG